MLKKSKPVLTGQNLLTLAKMRRWQSLPYDENSVDASRNAEDSLQRFEVPSRKK
jgi:hypothetical protein